MHPAKRSPATVFACPISVKIGAIPVAVKVNLAYTSDTDPSGLPKAIVDEVELLTAGAIGTHGSYFLEQCAIDGGRPGRPRDVWIVYDTKNGGAHVRGELTQSKCVLMSSTRSNVTVPLKSADRSADSTRV